MHISALGTHWCDTPQHLHSNTDPGGADTVLGAEHSLLGLQCRKWTGEG